MNFFIAIALSIATYTVLVREYYKRECEKELEKIKREPVFTFDAHSLHHVVASTNVDRDYVINNVFPKRMMEDVTRELLAELEPEIRENLIICEEDIYKNKYRIYVDVWLKK